MAFEDKTYDSIIADMLERVTTQYPELDAREGGILFNAMAAAAMEISIAYAELGRVYDEGYAQTATRTGLMMLCEEMGIDTFSLFSATYGVFKGVFDVDVPSFSRWNLGEYNYIIIEPVEEETDPEQDIYTYTMQCEVAGTGPNGLRGDLTPTDYVNASMQRAEITECIIAGRDEATDDEIREYYYSYVSRAEADGNVEQYNSWCEEYVGSGGLGTIGNHRIFPLEDGRDTVTVSILNSENKPASQALIDEFQEYLDPKNLVDEDGNPIPQGMGNGVAPIGAIVTVDTATEKTINVTGTVQFEPGYSDTEILDNAIRDYFNEIAYEKSAVIYMSLGAKLIDTEGVDFVSNLTVNGGQVNVALGDKEIPKLGTTSWTVL